MDLFAQLDVLRMQPKTACRADMNSTDICLADESAVVLSVLPEVTDIQAW